MEKKGIKIEWMCTHCGKKVVRVDWSGRPLPGKCPRRTKDMPHRWVKNRTY